MNQTSHFFEGLDGRSRTPKPRTQGLTMVVDWGLGPHEQEDLLVVGADFFDFAKVAVGISRLLSNEALTRKLNSYFDHAVEPYPGGQYFEMAEIQGAADLYLESCARAGYRWIEVSDNMAEVDLKWKEKVIRKAVEEYGFKVFGEVGKKEGLGNLVPLPEDAERCREAGSEIILLEAAELIGDDAEAARLIESVVEAVGLERVMFELPGPWIADVHAFTIHQMRVQLVQRFGPDVNLGNVLGPDLVSLEAYRRGLGVNAGKINPEE